MDSPVGIASNILASRLRQLCDSGLARRLVDQRDRRRLTYTLTPEGQKLRALLEPIALLGLEDIPGTEAKVYLNTIKAPHANFYE